MVPRRGKDSAERGVRTEQRLLHKEKKKYDKKSGSDKEPERAPKTQGVRMAAVPDCVAPKPSSREKAPGRYGGNAGGKAKAQGIKNGK